MPKWELAKTSHETHFCNTVFGLGFDFRSSSGDRWRQSFMPESGMDIGLLVSGIRELADSIEKNCLSVEEVKDAKAIKP